MNTKWVLVQIETIVDECDTLADAKKSLLEESAENIEIWEVTKRYKKEIITNIVEVED